MTSSKNVETVERFIPAPPAAIFDLLADPSRHRDIDGSGTVRERTAGSERMALGSRFRVNMKFGVAYSMESTIIEFVTDRRIAWQSRSPNKMISSFGGGRIWRYELEAVDGGTLVRESWDISQERGARVLVRRLRKSTREAMIKTLARIEEIVTG